MKVVNILVAGLFLWSLAACSNDVDFGEQYKKVIYLVNSKEKVYYAPHQPEEASPGSISVYCGGSKAPGGDILVKCRLDEEVLATYNQNEFGDKTERYFLLVPSDRITIESTDVVIKKGEEYGCMNFKINTLGLPPDRVYVLPVTIESASGYEIDDKQSTIIYVVRVQNEYAGDYSSTYKVGTASMNSRTKTAMAMTAKQILVPIGANSNEASYETGFFLIQLEEDNSLTLLPYLQTVVEALPKAGKRTNYYDPETKTFYLYYRMKDQWDDWATVDETLIKM